MNPDSTIRTVRDTDSHGWVQVYFPGYGWIDFEPTPAFPVHSRVPGAQEEASGESGLDLSPDVEGNGRVHLRSGRRRARRGGHSNRSIRTPGGARLDRCRHTRRHYSRGPRPPGADGHGDMESRPLEHISGRAGLPEDEPVSRLAGLRRRVHQTPVEYAETIASELPAVAGPAQRIGWALATTRYSSRQEPGEDVGPDRRSVEGAQGQPAPARPVQADTVGLGAAEMTLLYDLVETPFGWMGLMASERGLRRTTLPQRDPMECVALLGDAAGNAAPSPGSFASLRGRLGRYFDGEPVTFADEPVDTDDASPFLRGTWDACRSIRGGRLEATSGWARGSASRGPPGPPASPWLGTACPSSSRVTGWWPATAA